MVAKAETISESQFRWRFLRSGLRHFRASSNLHRGVLPHSSNSQLLAPNSSADINLYCYTDNDPINNLDPSGHDTKKDPPKPVYHPPQTQPAQNPNAQVHPPLHPAAKGEIGQGNDNEKRSQPKSLPAHAPPANAAPPAHKPKVVASQEQQRAILNFGQAANQDNAKFAALRADWLRNMQAHEGLVHSNLSDAQLYARMQQDVAEMGALEHKLGALRNEFNKAGLENLTVPGETLPAGDVLTYVPGGSGFANAGRMAGEISADWKAEDSGNLGGLQPTYDEVAIATGGPMGDLADAATGKVAEAVAPAVKSGLGKILDAVGSKIGSLLGKAGEAIGKLLGRAPGSASAANRASFEGYKDSLLAQMDRPAVKDPKLDSVMEEIYRPGAKVGSGSTAAAVREEAATGMRVGGKLHALKAEQYIKYLGDWLRKNPNAAPGDRAAAENVIRDMQNALSGK